MVKKFLILLIILIAGLWYWHNLNSPLDSAGRERTFTVSQGETAEQIANHLRKNNLIKSVFYFKYEVGRAKLNIKAGKYLISPKLTTREIIKILTEGNAVNQEKSIRIIEGWNLKDIGIYLEKNNVITAKDFMALAKAPFSEWKFDFLKPIFLNDAPKQATLEGYLFPDTYRIFNNTTTEEVILKMLANFDKKLTPEMRTEIKRQKKTIHEIVILASIIEKEVRTAEDMKIVSGLFWDRIKNGVPLQSDATLSYILDDKVGGHTIEDTKIDSPYNSYKYQGLPPGPIANPGLNAIMAAIYPIYTEYNYFLSDPANGKTIFSKSLEEHNINKAKYLK